MRSTTEVRRQIAVQGLVQGVGFRPYVYRLATSKSLTGTIRNTSAGVVIEVQGPLPAVEEFLDRLPAEIPVLAKITSLSVQEIPCNGDREFVILGSQGGAQMRTLISPDVAVCADCLRELFDPTDRRFGYPFINCTNCGPRFTIVRDIPYDRARTSMASFPMCPACQAEYDDPLNRRFHAQPNACWNCGPRVEFWDRSGGQIECHDPVLEAVERLRAGLIVAVKGLGGFHLAADANNPATVRSLRERKRRVEKPFAIMVPNIAAACNICEVSSAARATLESMQRPVVLLPRKDSCAIPEAVAPRNRDLGVFLPYTPLHHLLFARGEFPALVMTSANLSEEPIAIDNHEAVRRLQGIADFFLTHNRDILLRCDDSVVRVANDKVRHLRRSRGLVPVPVFLKDEQPQVLAVGGELKNTICLTKGKQAFLSQHVGDLENAEAYGFFGEAIEHLKDILEIQPEIIAYDLHPDYFSTKWASQQTGVRLVGVQHHHAHIASCMAENQLDGRLIGIALDGTGYGTDGRIWGGEVLVGGYGGFERAAHLEYVAMPGGEAAIREPWRMAVSYLAHHFGREFLKLPIPFVRQLDGKKTEILLRMMQQNVNSPLTSSCGRLFDAVAALAGIRQTVNYEAQAAIELEMAIAGVEADRAYPLAFIEEGETLIITTRPLFVDLMQDLRQGVPAGVIGRRFHNGLIKGFAEVAETLRARTALNRICLSGGTFNNVYFADGLESELRHSGFEVFSQSEVPAGDGGLSLGQAMIAAHNIKPLETDRSRLEDTRMRDLHHIAD